MYILRLTHTLLKQKYIFNNISQKRSYLCFSRILIVTIFATTLSYCQKQSINLIVDNPEKRNTIMDIAIDDNKLYTIHKHGPTPIKVYDAKGNYISSIKLKHLTHSTKKYRDIEVLNNNIYILNRDLLEVYNKTGEFLYEQQFPFYPCDIVKHLNQLAVIGSYNNCMVHLLTKQRKFHSIGKYSIPETESKLKHLPIIATSDQDSIFISSINSYAIYALYKDNFKQRIQLNDLRYTPSKIKIIEGRGSYYIKPSGINGLSCTKKYIVFSTYALSSQSDIHHIIMFNRVNGTIIRRELNMMYRIAAISDIEIIYLIGEDNKIYSFKL